ncbi:MAG: NAD(+)/NADH kinase, partial [Candidatus Lokiarchaeota archaeon]
DTNSEHTKTAAHIMKDMEELRLILFVGGDGTARDILDAVGDMKPCLGIPSGVKIYSSVFSLTPITAASIVIQFLWDELSLIKSEVLDIDEEAYRNGELISKLYGYLITPHSPEYGQYSKLSSPNTDQNNQERIADKIIEDLEAKIIVSLIGRQGFLFGRGNLQFTPKILKLIPLRNIIIIATKFKLTNLPDQCLRVDSRDPDLDAEMRGLYKVITDYDEVKIIELK